MVKGEAYMGCPSAVFTSAVLADVPGLFGAVDELGVSS